MKFASRSLLLLIALAGTLAYAETLPHFQHIIIVVQENRTPDNLFGSNPTFEPGVDIQQPASGPWCITLPPGAPNAEYFINYNGPILDPDNDVIDND